MKRIRSLSNKSVLITGAAGGIGSVLAQRLLFQKDARLILLDKDLEGLQKLKDKLAGESSKSVQIFEVDLANRASIEEFCEKIEAQEIDGLVNNAGIAYGGTFAEMDLDDFEKLIDVNLYAAVRLTRLLLPKLIQSHGFVVNVASGAGLLGPGGLNAYATSKFGLVGFSESLRAELKGQVRVSAVCPSFVKTPIGKNALLPPGLDPNQTEVQRELINELVQTHGLTSDRVGKAIIRSITKNRGLVVVGFNARLFLCLKKFSPRLVDFLNHMVFRKMSSRGYLNGGG